MNASEIIDALHKAGATLVIEEGRTRMRGAAVSAELKELVKANRAAVIEEWQRRQSQQLDRYAEVPTGEVPQCGKTVQYTKEQSNSVVAYCFRQPRPVHAWIMGRTNDYFHLGLPLGDDEICACIDLLCWQRNSSSKEALEWLAGLDECVATMKPL